MNAQDLISLKPASVGSISHGTFRPEDLISTYLSELEWHIGRNGHYFSRPENFPERDRLATLVGEAQDCFDDNGELSDPDQADYVIEDLTNALELFAPPYCYFGSHPADGSDIGFWPCLDSIRELPQISDSDPDLARELGEDCAYVNDHGNVTVYSGTGETLLELV